MSEPLTPADLDLRDFPYMPLDVVRLRDSETAVLASGDEFRAAVLLWCAAWHQVPAASLPDDDRLLANLAGFGRDVESWQAAREGALRGFVRCDDGRLYHPVIAEKANEAAEKRKSQQRRTRAATSARTSSQRYVNVTSTLRQRHVRADDQRNEQRNVVQGKGREEKGIEGKGEERKNRRSRAENSPRDELLAVLDGEHADAVIDHRSRLRRPLTARAARLLAGKFARCRDGPNAAADAMISRGWQGFEPEWLDNGNGRHKPQPRTLSDLAFDLAEEARVRERAAGLAGPPVDIGSD